MQSFFIILVSPGYGAVAFDRRLVLENGNHLRVSGMYDRRPIGIFRVAQVIFQGIVKTSARGARDRMTCISAGIARAAAEVTPGPVSLQQAALLLEAGD
jgi:hypothetical protein